MSFNLRDLNLRSLNRDSLRSLRTLDIPAFQNLTLAERKKVMLAAGLLALAFVILVWYLFLSGGGGVSASERAAQDKVLERIEAAPVAEAEPEPLQPVPGGELPPAGKARAVTPGG
jgi:hypothetical protein